MASASPPRYASLAPVPPEPVVVPPPTAPLMPAAGLPMAPAAVALIFALVVAAVVTAILWIWNPTWMRCHDHNGNPLSDFSWWRGMLAFLVTFVIVFLVVWLLLRSRRQIA